MNSYVDNTIQLLFIPFVIYFVYGMVMVCIVCGQQFYPDSSSRSRREGSGSTEATEMILNNLFYITTKVRKLPLNVGSV